MGQVFFVPHLASLKVTAAQGLVAAGQIDPWVFRSNPLSNLQNARIYVFSGNNDTVMVRQVVNSTVNFFQEIGVPPANLQYVNKVPADMR